MAFLGRGTERRFVCYRQDGLLRQKFTCMYGIVGALSGLDHRVGHPVYPRFRRIAPKWLKVADALIKAHSLIPQGDPA